MSIFHPLKKMAAEEFEVFPDMKFREEDSIILEIGPGRGDFLYELGENNPKECVVAIEYKRKRYTKLIERIQKRELKNVSLVWGNASYAISELFKDDQLAQVFILHPDPWPKRKHFKNRLIQKDFLELLTRKMKIGGILQIQTDDEPYSEWIQNQLDHVGAGPRACPEKVGDHRESSLRKCSHDIPIRSIKTLFEEKMAHKEIFTFNLEKC